MHSIPAKRRKSGFTLIELLVVIAIIAILAAILFPVFARARENARRASCQSNEKNIALGFKQYIQDNGEKYPPAAPSGPETKALGTGPLGEYIKSSAIFFCPSDSNKTGVSYGYDPPGFGDVAGKNESAIDNEPGGSSAVVLLTETGLRHFNGANLAYVDGHVKWSKTAPTASPTAVDPNDVDPAITASLVWNVAGTETTHSLASCRDPNSRCELDTPSSTHFDVIYNNGTSIARYLVLEISSANPAINGVDKNVPANSTLRFGSTNGWKYTTLPNSFDVVLQDPNAGKTRTYYCKLK